jgi:hypothetical protein
VPLSAAEPKKRRPGRPTKLSAKLQAEILEAISIGMFIEDACRAAGVSADSYERWKKWSEKGRKDYGDFFEAAQRAEAMGQRALVRILAGLARGQKPQVKDPETGEVIGVANPDLRAVMFALERGPWRKRWAEQRSLELSGPDGKPIETQGGTKLVVLPAKEIPGAVGLAVAAGEMKGGEEE